MPRPPDNRRLRASPWLAATALTAALAWPAVRDDRAVACDRAEAAHLAPEVARFEPPATGRGIDLQIRMGRLRIEFPWLRGLPVTPARRIVVTVEPWGAARP